MKNNNQTSSISLKKQTIKSLNHIQGQGNESISVTADITKTAVKYTLIIVSYTITEIPLSGYVCETVTKK